LAAVASAYNSPSPLLNLKLPPVRMGRIRDVMLAARAVAMAVWELAAWEMV
jgi:hypothetical protein